MPMSKQKSEINKNINSKRVQNYYSSETKPFFSRKYNQWFKSYESYLRYNKVQNDKFKKSSAQNLVYRNGYLYDSKTGKRLPKPTSNYRR